MRNLAFAFVVLFAMRSEATPVTAVPANGLSLTSLATDICPATDRNGNPAVCLRADGSSRPIIKRGSTQSYVVGLSAAPISGNDGKCVSYDNASGLFTFATCAGGSGTIPKLQSVYGAGSSSADSTITTDVTRHGVTIKDGEGSGLGIPFTIDTNSTFLDTTGRFLKIKNNGSDIGEMKLTTAGGLFLRALSNSLTLQGNGTGPYLRFDTSGLATFGTNVTDAMNLLITSGTPRLAPVAGKSLELYGDMSGGAGGAGIVLGQSSITYKFSNTLYATFDSSGVTSSNEVDGASAIGLRYDTINTLSTSGAKLAEWRNHTTPKLSIDKDGKLASAASTIVLGTETINASAGSNNDVMTYNSSTHVWGAAAGGGGGGLTYVEQFNVASSADSGVSSACGTFVDLTNWADTTTSSLLATDYLIELDLGHVSCLGTNTCSLEIRLVVDGSPPTQYTHKKGNTGSAAWGDGHIHRWIPVTFGSATTHTIKLQGCYNDVAGWLGTDALRTVTIWKR